MIRAGAHTNGCALCLRRELRALRRRHRSIYMRPAGEWEPWMPLGRHLSNVESEIAVRLEQLETVVPDDQLDQYFAPLDRLMINRKRRINLARAKSGAVPWP